MHPEDETRISEITITPDGRVYLFGLSRQVLEILQDLGLADPALQRRIDYLRPLGENGACTSSTDGRQTCRSVEAGPSEQLG